MEKNISKETLKLLLEMQQNEVTEHAVYLNLAKFVKKEDDKKVLIRIAKEEYAHSKILEKYTNKKLKPQKFKVFKFFILSFIFGYTFVIKIMEGGEKDAEYIYSKIVEEVPDAKKIAFEEDEHEKSLIDILDEERLKYVGSMVLGLSDALVEISGTLAGLSFALQNNRLVALSGIITGISATLSMASSEYLSAKADGDKNAFKSSLYTGIMYLITVTLLILPYLIYPNNHYLYALITMLCVVVFIIFFFTYYISVAKSLPFKKRFLEMAGISLTVAGISFLVGLLVKQFLGIDI
ncbi:VIT1/CCC1 transporter family protein [Brachyspira innocens]|uniref:VIT1/CCC1 transporter family protein n=1 Tax=Brachyspira innocens TaxID=13264 RepID=A0ABT8YX60_9SPIR|nr:VIT1/CCC1 transporter family protein [Brachyspira innocens]MDO6993924.1 VIT1/CCC1 transporter family protein [Brachyspira innocens]MDO7020482.1 VIT1/CCC1 transporter family protein [Brachyspira innocens]